MKKMSLKWMLLTLLSCSFVFFACSKDDDNNDPQNPEPEKATLSVSAPATGLEFEAAGGTKEVTVTTNQTEWKAAMANADDTMWCKLSQKDKMLTVKVVENEKETPRSGKIMLVAGSGDNTATAEIAVGQSLPEATLTLDPSTLLDFETTGGSQTVTITTNRSTWTAVLADADDAEWCILTQEDNILTVKTLKNTDEYREAVITVTAGSGETGKSLPLTVKQKFEVLTTYSLLDLYEKDGVKGIIFELNEDKTSGKIMSLTEFVGDFTTKNLKEGVLAGALEANSMTDGIFNTEKIKAYASSSGNKIFKAIDWAEEMNTDGITGWHIPAPADAKNIWNLYIADKEALNGALTNAGGVGMTDGRFSSASAGQPYEYVLGSSMTGTYDGYGAIWGIAYKDANYTETVERVRSMCQFDAVTYQFRAIRKF